MLTEEQINENLKKCPHFDRCSQNLCPVDLELQLRAGGTQDKCRWMREPKRVRIGNREFVSGGAVMPNGILNFVPEANLKRLNQSSQKDWERLKKNEI